jgi:hypothetical protein
MIPAMAQELVGEPTRVCPASGVGRAGVVARLTVGLTLLALAAFWRTPDWGDAAVGLVVAPAVVTAALWLRERCGAAPLRATGPLVHIANAVVLVALFFLPATAGPAFVFYGFSMLVAAATRSGGCEVTAISNALLRRDDQIGCPLFAPVDLVAQRAQR